MQGMVIFFTNVAVHWVFGWLSEDLRMALAPDWTGGVAPLHRSPQSGADARIFGTATVILAVGFIKFLL